MSFFHVATYTPKLKPQTKCMKCGSGKLVTGELDSYEHGVNFYIDKRTEKNGKVKVYKTPNLLPVHNSSMCLDCGFIELGGDMGDIEYIKKEYFKD
ncbi:MAG: hypothetical protein WCW27_02000 [Patescibacteria group bacterium]|jgi:hypothetical protein